jgi:hypoxanthine phosphoribosyltransferase
MNVIQPWETVERCSTVIAETITSRRLIFDLFVGIGTGGYIPLALVAKKLSASATRIVNVRSFVGDRRGEVGVEYFPFTAGDLNGKKILLIDDIVASGMTMSFVKKRLTDNGAIVFTASLIVSSRMCPAWEYPDFWGEILSRGEDEFLVFPWD